MKKLVIGILAHVDAGKTTLSEAMLYLSGSIRRLGRVDNQDAFLDTYEMERARGITIFAKQAILKLDGMQITLLDTPGHVDFSAEMERTLQTLDYAILVISGADGVQGHTQTLWRLLGRYRIPVFLFVNKMDQKGTNQEGLLKQLQEQLDAGCLDFARLGTPAFYESAAMCEEEALDTYLESGCIPECDIRRLIGNRKLFPCYFGSALKLEGVEQLIQGIETFTQTIAYPNEFGAKVYKITRDKQGSRLTHMKITGGCLKVRTILSGTEEKVNQIRIYSGDKYETAETAEAGSICAVTGLSTTRPGDGFGIEKVSMTPLLEPVLTYRIQLPAQSDAAAVLPKLYQLEEEEPQLHIVWNETRKEIQVQLMGEVQIEVLKSLIAERYGIAVHFGEGSIIYKETIAEAVIGVGHFEPLRHYAEVELLLEPGEPGSGLQFDSSCSEDILDRNWQRLALKHLKEKEHIGVLTGSAITDIKITLAAGRAHQKHTEGGDFRQAVFRALRQGLMKARSILLEPWYEFRLELPMDMTGRAMSDLNRMSASFSLPALEGEMAVLCGSAPAAAAQGYQREVTAYTRGRGRLFCSLKGYEPCHNTMEVLEQFGYEAQRDVQNPSESVFCSHGAGIVVAWDKVEEWMHLDKIELPQTAGRETDRTEASAAGILQKPALDNQGRRARESMLGTEEVERILERTFYANRRGEGAGQKGYSHRRTEKQVSAEVRTFSKEPPAETCLVVDGYNIIFAWEDLKELAKVSIDGARGKLQDLLCNYQAIAACRVIVVFDAYRVEGHETELLDYHNIHVVYTKEAETADSYIEKFAQNNRGRYSITVATSDGLEQIIIRGQGCALLSARELREEMERTAKDTLEAYAGRQPSGRSYLLEGLPEDLAQRMEKIRQAEQ